MHNFIDVKLVGCGNSTHRCRDSGTEFPQSLFYIPPDFEVYISANNEKIVFPHKIKNPPTEKTQAGFFALNTTFNTGLYYSLLPIFAVAFIEKFGQRRVFHDMNHVDEILRELILRQLVALDPEYSALGGIFELAAEAVLSLIHI